MIVGLDIGFGYTKTVTATGPDAFPSVVGSWDGPAPEIPRPGRDPGPRALALDGRVFLVGEPALRRAHRRFVPLSREWFGSPTYRALALAALQRRLPDPGRSVRVVTGVPVEDFGPHAQAVRKEIEGTHHMTLLPGERPWHVRIEQVLVLPQPLGTVFGQVLNETGEMTHPRLPDERVGILDVGFLTTDYFTIEALEVIPAGCLTRNTGLSDVLRELSRHVYARWGIECEPHELDEAALRGWIRVMGERQSLGDFLGTLLDEHAQAITAHALMLWGDQARRLDRVWLTGGGAQLLGARLEFAPHVTLVPDARIQNAVGYYRYGRMALRSEAFQGRPL